MLSFYSCLMNSQSVVERQSNKCRQSILTSAKSPNKLIGYHINIPSATAKLVSFIIPIHLSTNAESLVKITPVFA